MRSTVSRIVTNVKAKVIIANINDGILKLPQNQPFLEIWWIAKGAMNEMLRLLQTCFASPVSLSGLSRQLVVLNG